jgi:hypothetical protein
MHQPDIHGREPEAFPAAAALVACLALACVVHYEFTVVEACGPSSSSIFAFPASSVLGCHAAEDLGGLACQLLTAIHNPLTAAHCLAQVLFAFSVYVEAIKLVPQYYMLRTIKESDPPITNAYMFFQVACTLSCIST